MKNGLKIIGRRASKDIQEMISSKQALLNDETHVLAHIARYLILSVQSADAVQKIRYPFEAEKIQIRYPFEAEKIQAMQNCIAAS